MSEDPRGSCPWARPRISLNKSEVICLSDAEYAVEKERCLGPSTSSGSLLLEWTWTWTTASTILRQQSCEATLGWTFQPLERFLWAIFSIQMSLEAWELFAKENGPNAKFMPPETAAVQGKMSVYVIDIFATEGTWASVPFFASDSTIAPSLVRQGLFPCTPYFATVVFTARTLNAFHSLRMRCPWLGKQCFLTKRMCIDLEKHDLKLRGTTLPLPLPLPPLTLPLTFGGIPLPLGILRKQAFLHSISDMHGVALRPYLQTQFSAVYDLSLRVKEVTRLVAPECLPSLPLQGHGNNSLKRAERREGYTTADGVKVSGESVEAIDDQAAPCNYYIPVAEVDRFAKGGGEELLKGFLLDPKWAEGTDRCGDGWHNMKEHVAQKVRGVYAETGIFGTFCRHSICLLICDMIRSSELAKYGLAATFHLISVLRKYRLGYDIGCKFEQWVYTHPLTALATLAYGFEAVIGAFHGTRHKQLCQVRKIPIYTTSSGLEAFENMESVFSKSNALAGTTRHASCFHRQQDIVDLLDSKYRHALQVLARADQLLEAMDGLGLDRGDKTLEKLPTDPPEETLQMEYYQKSPEYDEFNKRTHKEEAERRRVLDRHERCVTVVEDLERRLDIGAGERWTPGSEEWVAAATLTREYQYRKSLNRLQGLIVARLLELSKANMMRKHIAKAIQARSKSLKTALALYNAAVKNLGDRPALTWEEILEMGRLEDIGDAPWAQPGAQPTLDLYFQLLHAEEEQERLNVEIKWWMTWMKEELDFLQYHERRLKEEGQAAQALQVHKYWMQQGRFYGLHQDGLLKLSRLPGFTGSIEPAVLEHGDVAPAAEEPVAGVEAALAASAAAENQTGGMMGERRMWMIRSTMRQIPKPALRRF
ncbi:hypothetical protein C8F04DRAFT_1343516 [Mycena alexandri]|uniref:CxC2-like cysteine cluster KDZ transposase-associated domain-containing protein n=1 Tax=Mycena alexandri TaxID=1745969 RepID=A0AAD6XCM6_9AGAR|nr:hypothetical protein C8F04DRAFT_1343516 [Mycena alexandri]